MTRQALLEVPGTFSPSWGAANRLAMQIPEEPVPLLEQRQDALLQCLEEG
ncbi:hypothetical protein [Thermogutta sp.]